MTKCTTCGVFQNRLQRGKLCDSCYNKNNNLSANMNNAVHHGHNHMNQSSQNIRYPAANPTGLVASAGFPTTTMNNAEFWPNGQVMFSQPPRPPQLGATNMNHNASISSQASLQQQNVPPQGGMSAFSTNSNVTTTPDNDAAVGNDQDPMIQQLMSKPSGELSAADIFQIVQLANRDIHNKIDSLTKHCNMEISNLKNNVQILQNEKKKKDDEIQTLKYTIIGMQKSINMIDSKEREKNAVIYGVPEDDMTTDAGILRTDDDKLKHILHLIECTEFDGAAFGNIEIERIGKARENYRRVMKVKCRSREDRDELMKNSKKLKDAEEIWKKVYIRKDEHPVYLAEKNRLRRKMMELKRMEENNTKEIVIKDGKLMIDATVVDKNTFFA